MKRTLLALAVPALLAAQSASADINFINQDGNTLSMYGRAKAVNTITNNQNGNGDDSNIRFGFNGVTQVTDFLSGYGRAEFQANAGSDSGWETRYAYAGLDFGSYGSFDYGRNDGVSKMVTNYTDVLPNWGGDAGDMVLLGDRETGVATYRNQGLFGLVDGLNFAIQYADRDNSSSDDLVLNDAGNGYYVRDGRQAYGIAAEYANILDSGFTVGATYALTSKATPIHYSSDVNGNVSDPDVNARTQSWAVGGNYQYENLYVAAIYNYTKNAVAAYEVGDSSAEVVEAQKVKGYEMVVGYTINLDVGALTPRAAYIQDKATRNSTGESAFVSKYVDLSVQYDFNKNLSAYVEYKINLLKDSDGVPNKQTKDSVALALTYSF